MPESSTTPVSRKTSQDAATFRHDLRNALAPALLCADILASHKDKTVQQNAGTIIDALENALKLLKKSSSSR